jgi:hypothetical protein
MARRGGTGTRQEALRRAQAATARRDADRIAREKAVQAALTDFFHATETAATIHADAKTKAERVLAEAADAARPYDDAVRDAVRELERLGETRADIIDLTGLSAMQVRQYLAKGSTGENAAARTDP